MKKKMYVYYQPNKKDLKDQVGDCAIRAFCKALNKDWVEVFDSLVPYARKAQCLINQKPAYEAFLLDNGFTYHPIPKSKRVTVEEFRKDYKGTAICYVRAGYGTHLVTCVDGKYYDTWDSGSRYMFGYYSREETA